jgi:hypothetical protein
MNTKWIIWWRDGSVTVWEVASWPVRQLLAMRNVVDVAPCDAKTAAQVSVWWDSDAAATHREFTTTEAMANVGMMCT